jgi:Derlin-2/3
MRVVDYPAALIVLDLVLGGPSKGIAGALGMFAGHIWYVPSFTSPGILTNAWSHRWFLHNYLPTHPASSIRRRNPLATPAWFEGLFPAGAARNSVRSGAGFTMSGPSSGRSTGANVGGGAVRERSTGYNWGRGGQRLGE